MDIQTGIRTRLQAITALPVFTPSGGVPTKPIFWDERPQGAPSQAIVLQVISDPIPSHLKGRQQLRSTLVQMDVYAKTRALALTISRQAIAILEVPATVSGKVFSACFVDNQRGSIEVVETGNMHRQSVDLSQWHIGD